MLDIKAARGQYDLRLEVEKCLGKPKQRSHKVWIWNCPFHEDREPSFAVYEDGYNCFGCGQHGDVFDFLAFWRKQPLGDVLKSHDIDPQAELQRKAEYAEQQARRLEAEIAKAQTALSELREVQSWVRYHQNLDDQARVIWETRGVPCWYQDWVKLGYDPSHTFWAGNEYQSPTLTIPIYEPETWEVLNVKHRILGDASDKIGKYRPERSGLPAALYPAAPDLPVTGRVLAVEGEIKAMVAYVTLADAEFQVVGLPSKNPNEAIIKQLQKCDDVILCLDPDADPFGVAHEIGNQARVMRVPDKLDDYILLHGLDGDWLKSQLRMARRS
jgi:hypothetical protein